LNITDLSPRGSAHRRRLLMLLGYLAWDRIGMIVEICNHLRQRGSHAWSRLPFTISEVQSAIYLLESVAECAVQHIIQEYDEEKRRNAAHDERLTRSDGAEQDAGGVAGAAMPPMLAHPGAALQSLADALKQDRDAGESADQMNAGDDIAQIDRIALSSIGNMNDERMALIGARPLPSPSPAVESVTGAAASTEPAASRATAPPPARAEGRLTSFRRSMPASGLSKLAHSK
jgi:hypothetical protein